MAGTLSEAWSAADTSGDCVASHFGTVRDGSQSQSGHIFRTRNLEQAVPVGGTGSKEWTLVWATVDAALQD